MPRTAPTGPLCEIRALRRQLQRSQTAFAALLGVSAETYRTWDSGRRAVPEPWVNKARALAAREDPARRWSLAALAAELGVHVRTLRNAARSGRLRVTFEHRVVFGHLVPRATLTAGRAFVERYYKRSYSRVNGNRKPHICGNRKLHTSGRYISGGADVLPLMLVGRFGLDAGSGATGVLANTRREAAQPAVTLRLSHAAVPTQPAASADAPASGSCCPGC